MSEAERAAEPYGRISPLQLRTKRAMDIAGAGLIGLVAAPILVAAAGAVVLSSGRPILFRQERIGLGERPFELLKFRTMTLAPPDGSELTTDAARVTKVGELLRRTSLDELPQLWNVLRGDMSLVGPRPLLALHLPLYTPEQRRRHQVRPGLTGLAQVAGRRGLTFSRRFALDVEYVDGWTTRGDVVLLARTLVRVLRGVANTTGQDFADVDDIGLEEAVRQSGR